nr:restriction endonuclease [Paenibacillus xylanexedens]
MINKGKLLEEYIHYVYSSLLKMEEKNALITKDVVITGNDGQKNQFDVYYEFIKAGVPHRVAIECKNHTRPIERKEVHDFACKLESVAPMQGVMIAPSGFQEGARIAAKNKGITLLMDEELPKLTDILSKQISYIFLPDENVVGEPFWALMMLNGEGENTGNYVSFLDKQKQQRIPIFISKKTAENFRDKHFYHANCGVRGIRQHQLMAVIEFSKIQKFEYLLVTSTYDETEFEFQNINTDHLKRDYLTDY